MLKPEDWSRKGGLRLWAVPRPHSDLFVFRAAMPLGPFNDSEGEEGTAQLLSLTLGEGGGDLDAPAFHEALENKAIELSFSLGQRYLYLRLSGLVQHWKAGVDLLNKALNSPRFDVKDVKRKKTLQQTQIEAFERDPDTQAALLLRRTLYPTKEGQRYSRPSVGGLESLKKLKGDHLHGFLAKNRALEDCYGCIVGGLGEEIAEDIHALFSDWPKVSAEGGFPFLKARPEKMLAEKEWPSPQAVIAFGQQGLAREHEDYYALNLVNLILGAIPMSARLFQELREKRGLTYGVYTRLHDIRVHRLILGQFSTSKETAEQAMELIKEEWKKMAGKGPNASELAVAKTYAKEVYVHYYTSSPRIAHVLLNHLMEGLPLDYSEKRSAYFNRVTLEQCRKLCKKLLEPDKLCFARVG